MREIKFRGKCIPEFPHPVAKWVYGSFVSDKLILSPYKERNENRHFWYMVDPATVGQFTGLLDSNGEEIYEGDIVKVDGWRKPTLVEWFDANAQFVIDRSLNLGLRNSFMQVIGNVHDSPELLEADHERD